MSQDWVNNWIPLGVTSDVPVGAVVPKRIDRIDLALFNLDGEIFARTDACSGCGDRLSDGRIKDSEIECAGCGLRVSIAQPNRPSAPPAFPVMLVDDEIFVWIDRSNETPSS